MSVFFIAEAGVNHNGSLEIAEKLIDVAAESGADAVKFQTFKADETVVDGTDTVAYQKQSSAQDSQFELLRKLELSPEDHVILRKRCEAVGIEFMSTAFDLSSAFLLRDLGVHRLKVPSGELTNLPFIKQLAEFDLPIILSTGMGTMEEVELAVECIAKTKGKAAKDLSEDLSILHCTSAYPAPDEAINLRAIQTMAEHFGLPVGYSDHSKGNVAALMSVAMGSVVYEKHFTLDRTMEGPDHAASMEPDELTALVADMRRASMMLGSGVKAPHACELEARRLVRRSIVAGDDLPVGHILSLNDLKVLRPEGGLPPAEIENLPGLKLKTALKKGQPVSAKHFEGRET